MATKKAPPPAAVAEPKGQLSILTLKGTAAYKDWLAGFGKATHIPATTLLRLGLVEMARKHGHPEPPEK